MNTATEQDTEHTPMLTPTEVIEHIFCPRFTWFMNVQHIPQHEDKRFKVLKGRKIHARRESENKRYLRRKIGVTKKQNEVYLASPKLRMRGIVDEVLWLKDGTMAPLDYKYTEVRQEAFKTHRIQVLMYAMLIRETYDAEVSRGFVAYIRSTSKLLEIQVTEQSMQEALSIVDNIFAIITTGKLPGRTRYRIRCRDCCYKNICV